MINEIDKFHQMIIEELATNESMLFIRLATEYAFNQTDPALLTSILDAHDFPKQTQDGRTLSLKERMALYSLTKDVTNVK